MTRKGSEVRVLYGPLRKCRSGRCRSFSAGLRTTRLSTEVAVTGRASTGKLDRARFERLARIIGEELRTQTCSQALVADVNVEEWRRAARLAGRRRAAARLVRDRAQQSMEALARS